MDLELVLFIYLNWLVIFVFIFLVNFNFYLFRCKLMRFHILCQSFHNSFIILHRDIENNSENVSGSLNNLHLQRIIQIKLYNFRCSF